LLEIGCRGCQSGKAIVTNVLKYIFKSLLYDLKKLDERVDIIREVRE